jgi:hypothetical protein
MMRPWSSKRPSSSVTFAPASGLVLAHRSGGHSAREGHTMPISDDRLRALVSDVVARQLDLEVAVSKQLRLLGASVERLDETVSQREQSLRGRLLEDKEGGNR